LLGLGHLTRLIDAGLPYESLRDPGLGARLKLDPGERQQVDQALKSFAPLFAQDAGIDQVWKHVEQVVASAGLDYTRAKVLEQLGPKPSGASWVGAGAILEKALHSAVKSPITPESRLAPTRPDDPRKAGNVEHRGHGRRAQEWFFDQGGAAIPLHRNLNPLWAAHEVGPEGRIIRVADQADVSGQTELRQALFEDKLGQLAAINVGHAGVGLLGTRGAIPALERAGAEAHALLLQLAAGAGPEETRFRQRLINHKIGSLEAPGASGEQWFVDRFDHRMALHLPLDFRLNQGAIAGGTLGLEQRRDLFEGMQDHYGSMSFYLDLQLCPPDARVRIEAAVREYRAGLEQLVGVGGSRKERDWAREAKGRLVVLDLQHERRLSALGYEPLQALQEEIAAANARGADTQKLVARVEESARAYEAKLIALQPETTPSALLARVDQVLGLASSAAPAKATRAPVPSPPAGAIALLNAYVHSFQTGVRAPEEMAALEAALSDPAVTIVHRTVIRAGSTRSAGPALERAERDLESPPAARAAKACGSWWSHVSGAPRAEPRTSSTSTRQAPRWRAAHRVSRAGRWGRLLAAVRAGKSATELGLEKLGRVPGAHQHLERTRHRRAKRPIALFDQVIGNLDRHGGNFLVVRPVARTLVPIDHGICLPLVNWRQDSSSVLEEEHRLAPADLAALDALIATRGELVAELLELKIDPRAILALFERVGELAYRKETADDWSNRGARGP
jgi:hypothetical protein